MVTHFSIETNQDEVLFILRWEISGKKLPEMLARSVIAVLYDRPVRKDQSERCLMIGPTSL